MNSRMKIRQPIVFILGVILVCFTPTSTTATDVDFSHRNAAWVSHACIYKQTKNVTLIGPFFFFNNRALSLVLPINTHLQ